MKKALIAMIFAGMLIGLIFGQTESDKAVIGLESVDQFLKIADKLSAGNMPSEEEWQALFNTQGYKISNSYPGREDIVRNIAIITFAPGHKAEQDSVLSISLLDTSKTVLERISKLTISNYLDMKKNMKALKKFRKSYDFNSIAPLASKKLKGFLPNPVDSLITFPKSVYMICSEADSRVKPGGMLIDFNSYYMHELHNANVKLMAHEMFHVYRENFENADFRNSNYMIWHLDQLQNEGIADQIDKKGTIEEVAENLMKTGGTEDFAKKYINSYYKTPKMLKASDSLTVLLANNKITEEKFNKEMDDFFPFGGHPNSYYMTELIKKAGLWGEVMENFYSPIEFIKIYNRAAKQYDEYVFSKESIDFLESIKKKFE